MNEEPEFCKYCGRPLIRKTVSDGFDGTTGESKTIDIAECPGAGWQDWFTLNHHSLVKNVSYQFMGETKYVWVWLLK